MAHYYFGTLVVFSSIGSHPACQLLALHVPLGACSKSAWYFSMNTCVMLIQYIFFWQFIRFGGLSLFSYTESTEFSLTRGFLQIFVAFVTVNQVVWTWFSWQISVSRSSDLNGPVDIKESLIAMPTLVPITQWANYLELQPCNIIWKLWSFCDGCWLQWSSIEYVFWLEGFPQGC